MLKHQENFLLKIDTRENEPVVEIVGHEVVFEVLGQNFSEILYFINPKLSGEPIVAKVENLDLEMGTEGQSQVKIRDGSGYMFVSNMGTQVDIEGSAVINVFGLKTSVERFKLISNTGFSDFDYTYENDVISVPGGPFLSVSAERMSVSILEQTVRGNFNFEKTNNGYVKASVSDGSLSLGSESSPLLEFNQLNGSFLLSDQGVSAMVGGVPILMFPQLLLVVRIRLSSITLRKKKILLLMEKVTIFQRGHTSRLMVKIQGSV